MIALKFMNKMAKMHQNLLLKVSKLTKSLSKNVQATIIQTLYGMQWDRNNLKLLMINTLCIT